MDLKRRGAVQEGFNPHPPKCAYVRGGEVMDEVKVMHVRVALGSDDLVRVHSALRGVLFRTNLSSSPLCLHTHSHTLFQTAYFHSKNHNALKCDTFVLWCTPLNRVAMIFCLFVLTGR